MTLFLLAFVVGLCSGLATWAISEMHRQYAEAQHAHQPVTGYC